MIVEPVRVEERDGVVSRTATVRWSGGEYDLRVSAPPGIADPTDDMSGFLGATLLPAMRCREDLEVRGPVSPRLLRRCEEIRALYRAWAPGVSDVVIRAERGPVRTVDPDARVVSFLSRGVDSIFTAAYDREDDRQFDALVFVDEIEPRHDETVRKGEIECARATADKLGLPMVVAATNIREFTDPIVLDWEDMCGAGLASVAQSLAGGVQSATISSTDNYASIEPTGTSPLLDPMFSTERVRVEHSSFARGRLGKVRWLVEHRPDLVPDLKVCYKLNGNDNCCECAKCYFTMACLLVCGALDAAPQFALPLDIDAIASMRLPNLKHRVDWATIATLDDDGAGGALRAAAQNAMRNAVKRLPPDVPGDDGPTWVEETSFGRHWLNQSLSLLLEGEARPPVPPIE